MYKILIVDDNEIQLRSIKFLIECKKYNISEIETAYNGSEGIMKVKKFKPDIVITDIEMPDMSGIEMVKEISKKFPEIKIIFISCYEKFEYIKEAMQNYAVGYLLKPIVKAELEQSIEEALKAIKMQRHDKDVKELVKQNIMLLVESLLYKRVYSQYVDFGYYESLSKQLEIEGFVKFVLVKTMVLDNSDILADTSYVFSLFNQLVSERISQVSVIEDKNMISTLILIKDEVEYDYILKKVKEISKIIKQNNIRVNIGISNFHSAVYELGHMINEANTELENIVLTEDEYFISNSSEEDFDIKKDIEALLAGYSKERIQVFVDKFCPESTVYSGQTIRSCYVAFVAAVQIFLIEHNMDFEELLGEKGLVWEKQNRFSSIEEFRRWLLNILCLIIESVLKYEQSNHEKMISDMISFINKNYASITNTEQVASSVYISESYARNIFKKYVGKTIQQYLTSVRMEEAKRMLARQDSKIYDVAEQVGYQNKSHFVELFTREFGMKPAEFKEKALKEKE